jgi:hypothetical protein
MLAAVLWVFFRWVADTAAAWFAVALRRPSPKPYYLAGVLAAGLVLGIFYGDFFSYVSMSGSPDLVVFSVILAVLGSIILLPSSAVAFLVLACLWALPLAARLWERRAPGPAVEDAASRWAFLDAPSGPIPHTGAPFAPWPSLRAAAGDAVKFAAAAVILYGLFWLLLRLVVPLAVRDQDGFRIGIFIGMVLVSIPFQMLSAGWVAARAQRLSAYHGLFAAFLCGAGITVGMLALVLLFGGSPDLAFAWQMAKAIIISGAIFSIPPALIAARRHLTPQPRLAHQPSA